MYLIQILLPLYSNTKQAFPKEQFAEVRKELVERFGGMTAYTRAPASGVWQEADGETVRDDLLIHEVMTDVLDHAWWRQYRSIIETRFAQDAIVVRAQKIDLL